MHTSPCRHRNKIIMSGLDDRRLNSLGLTIPQPLSPVVRQLVTFLRDSVSLADRGVIPDKQVPSSMVENTGL